jgi:iron complex transport system permease protein
VKSRNSWIIFLFFFHLLLVIFLFSARLGTVDISWQAFWESFVTKNPQNLASVVIRDLRIPRFFMAALAGGSLAMAGQAMQILVRNPLADPYTMGTASGAALGVNLVLSGFLPAAFAASWFLPFWGFAGALLTTFLVLAIVASQKRPENSVLLLIGVAVSILANSLISLLTYFAARENEVRHMLFWAFGNLDKSNWDSLVLLSVVALPTSLVVAVAQPYWNLLLLGDQKAASLGIPVGWAKRILLILSAILTTMVVCTVGPIGFVGLVVPFWVRKWRPITHPQFWYLNFLSGAAFLSFCDLIARIALPSTGLPIGLVTSLLGVPFFVYLLRETSVKANL